MLWYFNSGVWGDTVANRGTYAFISPAAMAYRSHPVLIPTPGTDWYR